MSSVGKIKELGAQLQLQRFCQETAGSLPKALNVKLIDPVTGQPTAETSVDLWRAVMPVNNVAITGPDSVLPIWPPAARPPIMGQDPNGPNRRVLAAYDWDWSSAEKEYKRAIELNPRYGTAHQWYGGYLAVMGRSDEPLAERKLAQELEPLSLTINFELGLAFYHARAYDQAIEQLQKTLELDQHFPAAPNLLPAAYEQHGMYSQAIAEFKKSIPLIAAR